MIKTMTEAEKYKDAINYARRIGPQAFFSWFDGGVSVDGSFFRADNTFKTMMWPFIDKYLRKPYNKKISLDIGYGGGGQVYAASKIFKYSFGIDVHSESDFVEHELMSRGAKNIFLHQSDGMSIPYTKDKTIDFIHSWAVFMHLGDLRFVIAYLNEISRVLKYGGVAVIYFSRLIRTKIDQTIKEYNADLKEEERHKVGAVKQDGVPVNQINSKVAMWRMITESQRVGLTVVDRSCSFRHVNGEIAIGGQHGIVLRKDRKAVINEFVSKET